ncbi:hypothetical protein BDD12DRAFT_860118 [Trichophaea hybrida]|nr:hypothetical protein BDD12DRAFT_860118 [Trichophaea hybrida]
MAALLHLPPELLSNILQFLTTSSDATTHIHDLINVAKTCSTLHHAIFYNDVLWRSSAISLGISPTQLNYTWSQGFPDTSAKLPPSQKVKSLLPAKRENGGRRTIEMCVMGFGAMSMNVASHAVSKHRGKAFFKILRPKTEYTTGGMLDLESKETTETTTKLWRDPINMRCRFIEPGYNIEEEDGIFRINELGVEEPGQILRCWKVGTREIRMFRTRGDLLVGGLRPSVPRKTHVGTNVVCMRAEGRDVEASILWERDVSEIKLQSQPFSKIHDFQLNSTHVVCLLGIYRDFNMSKLNLTQFYVMDLHTGKFRRSMNFQQSPLSAHSAVQRRRMLTTAFDCSFLLTDKFCVSGGHGGELLVWDYTRVGIEGFLRTFTTLTLSVDGRYIGATLSDQLFVIDMVAKKVHARYSNGRRVKDNELHAKNPKDEFLAGIWCWWKDWDGDDGAGWKEADSGVAYLCGGEDENPFQNVTDVARRKPSLWDCSVFVLGIAVWIGSGRSQWLAAMFAVFTVCFLLYRRWKE